MDTRIDSENQESLESVFLFHGNLFQDKILSRIFSELGQSFDKEQQKEIILQILVVTLLVPGYCKVEIEGIPVFENHYKVAKAVILTHIIDDLFDNSEVFRPISYGLYNLILNFNSEGGLQTGEEKKDAGELFEYIILAMKALHEYDLKHGLEQVGSDVQYNQGVIPILINELQVIQDDLQGSPDKVSLFRVGIVNMVLAGLIQNLEKFGIESRLKIYHKNKIQVNAGVLYRDTLLSHISEESSLAKWYGSDCALEVLVTNSSAILQIFLVLSKNLDRLDMDLVEALNSILGGCVYLINRTHDATTSNAVFYPKNLKNEEREEAYTLQLEYSFEILINKLEKAAEVNGGLIRQNTLEYNMVVAIIFVKLLFSKYNESGMSFANMPKGIGRIFTNHFERFSREVYSLIDDKQLNASLMNLMEIVKNLF